MGDEMVKMLEVYRLADTVYATGGQGALAPDWVRAMCCDRDDGHHCGFGLAA
jgi:hypothetical protein